MRLLVFCVLAAFTAPTVDRIFEPLANDRTPGLAVLVRQDGRTVFEHGYGVRDLRTRTPIDAATNFRLASCTKQFTAAAIMLLVHDGKLHYTDTLPQIFPGFPAYGRVITVRHLLTHTSGLPDYEELMEHAGTHWTAEHQIQDEEVFRLLAGASTGKFVPGTSWAYSNSGYVILGLIVAKASGMPFDRFLAERIFHPLHMDGTLAYVRGKNTVPRRAYGHTRQGDVFTETDQSSTSATLGDGGVYSNLADLARWDDALRTNTLLPETEMRAALTPVRLADGSQPRWPAQPEDDNLAPGQPVAYGYGWFLDPYRGRPRMWHFGSTTGFRTAIERFPGNHLTVIVLANRTDLDVPALALRAIDSVAVPN